ncbi:MAG: hypothetical protein QGG87_02950 [Nitrospinota bacterium]|jgi:hypothetical protein|nr:hypothetical protein [Nitrospinota bacterium]
MNDIASNIRSVKEAVMQAAEKTGRNYDEIKLIAISKTVEINRIKEAVDAGLTIFGENRVQEAQKKKPSCLHPLNGTWSAICSLTRSNTYLICSS